LFLGEIGERESTARKSLGATGTRQARRDAGSTCLSDLPSSAPSP
jgi:hypothetical protein